MKRLFLLPLLLAFALAHADGYWRDQPVGKASTPQFRGLTLNGATSGSAYFTTSATGGYVGLSNSPGLVPTHQFHISTDTNNALGIDSTDTDSNSMAHIKNVGVQGPFFDFWASGGRYAWGVSSGNTFDLRSSGVGTDPVNGTTIFSLDSTGTVLTGGLVKFTSGTSRTLATPAEIIVCTTTCTITPPATLTVGSQFCVQNDDNVSTVITLAAVSGIQYEATARTSYGTANRTMTSGGAVGDQMCMVAISTTKYNVFSSVGTWTNTP